MLIKSQVRKVYRKLFAFGELLEICFFAVTRITTEARVEIGGTGGGVTDAHLRRVEALDQSRTG